MKRLLVLLLVPGLALGQAQPPFMPELFLRNESFQTQLPYTLYVATTGSDSNSCTDSHAPCLTIQGACDKVPPRVLHQVLVSVGAGTFSAGCTLVGRTFGAVSTSAPGQVIFRGTTSTYATGTLTSRTLGSACTRDVYTDSNAAYSTNELAGKLFQVTVSGTTHTYPIQSNTATAITIEGLLPTPQPAGNEAYSILDRATVINGVLGYSIEQPGPTSGAANKVSSAASFVVDSPQSVFDTDSAYPQVSLERLKFSYASAKQAIWAGGSLAIRESEFGTNAIVLKALTGLKQLSFVRNTINTTQAGVNLAGTLRAMPSLVQFFNNVVLSVSDSSVLSVSAAGNYITKYNYIVGSGYRSTGMWDGNSICDILRPSTGRCIDFRGLSSSNSCSGTWNFDGLNCQQTSSSAIQSVSAGTGSCTLTFDRNSIANSSITSGGGTGGLFIASGGSRVILGASTSLTSATPSNNDFVMGDGTAGISITDWNAMVVKNIHTAVGSSISASSVTANTALSCGDDTSCGTAGGVTSLDIIRHGNSTCSSGTKSLSFKAAFSAAPDCTCSTHASTASACSVSATSTIGLTAKCGGASDDFTYTCVGQR
jgi:hypothetical protein